jgi:hypothetical protein
VVDAHPPLKQARSKAGRGEKLPTTRSAAGRRGKTQPATTNTATGVAGTGLRMTALTRDVLGVIAELGTQGLAPSNREIARVAAVKDQGQISKLLTRLQSHGLLENTGGHPAAGNAWRLTARGEELLAVSGPAAGHSDGMGAGPVRISAKRASGTSSQTHLQVNGMRETR